MIFAYNVSSELLVIYFLETTSSVLINDGSEISFLKIRASYFAATVLWAVVWQANNA